MAEQYDGDIKLAVTLDASSVKQSAEQLRSTIQEIINQIGNIPFNENLERMSKVLQDMVTDSQILTEQLDQVGQNIGGVGDQTSSQQLVEQVAEQNNEMRQSITQATGALDDYSDAEIDAMLNAQRLGQQIGNVFSIAANRTRALIRRFTQLAARIARMGASIIKSGLSKLGSIFFGGSKGAESFTQKLHKGIRTVLAYGLGIQTLASLFGKLRGAATEAFQRMAQQIPEVNRSISMLKSAIQNLKNSIGTALQPLLSAIAPVLTRIINLFAQAATKVGEFFAALTGQKYIYKATEANIDYAKSLDKTTKAKKKKNKEDEKELGAYDKLLVIQKKTKDENDDGNGYDADAAKGMYQKVPIDPKWLKIADWLKDMWKRADFFELGALLAQKLKELLQAIPWDYIKYLAAKIGKSIATFFNGIFADIELAREIGNAIAQAFNTALTLAYNFVKYFEWKQFGKWFGELISSALRNVDWHMLREFAKEFGTGIAEAFNGLMSTDVLYQIGNAIGNLLRAAIDFAFNLLNKETGIDFDQLAQKIVSGIKRFFKVMNEVDETGLNGWQKLGKAISDALYGVLHTINTVLGNEDLRKSVGKAITDFLNSIDFQALISELGQLLVNIAMLFVEIIRSALASDTFRSALLQLAPLFATALTLVFAGNVILIVAKEVASQFLKGFAQGLIESGALTSILGDLAIFCSFIISSVIAIFAGAEMGKTIGKYMFPDEADVYEQYQGITGTFTMLKEFIEAIAYELGEAWGLFKERTIEHFQALKESLGGIWNVLMSMLSLSFSSIMNGIVTRIKFVYDYVMNVVQAISNALSWLASKFSFMQGAATGVQNFANKIRIPGLANGAVIPPNSEFIAMLGDQKNGVNIETPLDTMVQAFKNAIAEMGGTGGGNNQPILLQLDGRTVASVVWDEQKKRYAQTGQYNPRMV